MRFQTEPQVDQRTFSGLIAQVEAHEALTVGTTQEHAEFLRRRVAFGGGCLVTVFRGELVQDEEIPSTQDETLF